MDKWKEKNRAIKWGREKGRWGREYRERKIKPMSI